MSNPFKTTQHNQQPTATYLPLNIETNHTNPDNPNIKAIPTTISQLKWKGRNLQLKSLNSRDTHAESEVDTKCYQPNGASAQDKKRSFRDALTKSEVDTKCYQPNGSDSKMLICYIEISYPHFKK